MTCPLRGTNLHAPRAAASCLSYESGARRGLANREALNQALLPCYDRVGERDRGSCLRGSRRSQFAQRSAIERDAQRVANEQQPRIIALAGNALQLAADENAAEKPGVGSAGGVV